MFFVLRINFLSLMLLLISCGPNNQELYCRDLREKMKKEGMADHLEKWVVDHIFKNGLKKSDVKFEGRMVPGFYRYYGDRFDWKSIGFDDNKSQVRIVGPHPEHVNEERVDNIISVFFAERSRAGFIVKDENSKDYGVGSDSKYLTPVSENVAIICIPRD